MALYHLAVETATHPERPEFASTMGYFTGALFKRVKKRNPDFDPLSGIKHVADKINTKAKEMGEV